MATVIRHVVTASFYDSRAKTAVVSFFISAANAAAYIAAADDSARAATQVGLLIAAIAALTIDNGPVKVSINTEYLNSTAIPPVDNAAYNFDKFATTLKDESVVRNLTYTIPGRAMEAVALAPDGVTVIIDSGAGATTQTTNYIDALIATALSDTGGALIPTRMYVAR